ncbi:MAG: response regulator [Bacteroidetes bacterium]|nr:response regulator [Bacteroidota bacterium]
MKTKQKHIFIVDDDEFILWILKARFEKENYKVTLSSNVDDAYFKVNVIKPSVMLLDIVLPGMNGLDFMNMVHSRLIAEHVPVVIMSALTQPGVMQTAYKLGAKAYITKPFSMDYAYEIVDRISTIEHSYIS